MIVLLILLCNYELQIEAYVILYMAYDIYWY
mgnify:CR=1 FL=1